MTGRGGKGTGRDSVSASQSGHLLYRRPCAQRPLITPAVSQENLTVTEFSSLQSVHEEPNSWAGVFNCTAHF